MDRTGEFIDLFRRLEAALRENALTGTGPREFNGMINALARQDPFIQARWEPDRPLPADSEYSFTFPYG